MNEAYTPYVRQLVADIDAVRALELERALLQESVWSGVDLGFEPGRFNLGLTAQDYAAFDAAYLRQLVKLLRVA